MHAKTQLETVNVNAEKCVDWAISSQALQECREGSTTSARSPDRTVKRHECRGCTVTRKRVVSPWFTNYGDTTMAERKFFVTEHELRAKYHELRSALKVAAFYSVSKKLVLTYMKRYGIEKLPRRMIDYEVGDLIESMALNLDGSRKIAAVTGFSPTSILRYAKKNGVTIHDMTHPGWCTTDSGYIKLLRKSHPRADSKGYVAEHVLVMEAHLGRFLADDEVVHHEDYDKANNDLPNLRLMTDKEHRALHLRAKDCGRWMA